MDEVTEKQLQRVELAVDLRLLLDSGVLVELERCESLASLDDEQRLAVFGLLRLAAGSGYTVRHLEGDGGGALYRELGLRDPLAA